MWWAERVGFVPEGSAPLNDFGRIGTARTRWNLQKPEDQVQNRDSTTAAVIPVDGLAVNVKAVGHDQAAFRKRIHGEHRPRLAWGRSWL